MKKQKRGRGRPPTWKLKLLGMRWGQSLQVADKSEAMSCFVAARRMGYTTTTHKQPNGSYIVTKIKATL